MILEILTWLQLASVESLTDLNQSLAASNVILLCYLAALLMDKRCMFLIVFLICEVLSYSGLLNQLSNFMYYLVFAGIYATMYHYLYYTRARLKTIFACGLIVLFDAGTAIDAFIYPDTETILYKGYELFVVAVHLYFILSLINWKILRSIVGASFSKLVNTLGVNYNLSFICYTKFILDKRE